ncbi:MAG: response regulator [Nitrospiraceae bacterium]|nr:response regulator [Nitrospiraceae bacterium]
MPKILIAENNAKTAYTLGQFLVKKGMEADLAVDGEDGLRSVREKPFDLLLVNLKMPQVNGDDICREARKAGPNRETPIIMVSGFSRDQAEIDALTRELRLSSFLTKPFTSVVLFSQIENALQGRPSGQTAPAQAAAAPALPPSMTADLAKSPFEKVLFYLMKKNGTGVLTVTRDSAERRFAFIGGAPVEIDLVPDDHDFGRYLSRRKLVSGPELKAYDTLRASPDGAPRDLFVRMGCLTPEQFQEESRNFLHERLVDCFAWKTGAVVFDWKTSFVPAVPEARAFLPVLFYRGFRAYLPTAAIGRFLEQKGPSFVSRTGEFYDYGYHLAGEIPNPELFDILDGSKTCSEIMGIFETDESATVLYTLDYLRVLAYSPTPLSAVAPPFPVRKQTAATPAQPEEPKELFEDLGGELTELAEEIGDIVEQLPETGPPTQDALEEELKQRWREIRDRNYYEIFGLTPKTYTLEKLKKAYFDFTSAYGPEKFFASSGTVMELAQEFLSRISNAYAILSNVVSKESYDSMLATQAPTETGDKKFYEQVQFQSGKVMLEQGQYEEAERTFGICNSLNPEKPEYQVYLAYAIYQNPANKSNPAMIKQAKDLVNRSLQWDKLAIAYALKGIMLLDEGLLNLAESEFQKALRLSPNNRTALSKLDQIRQARENQKEEKGGLFRRMFK